MQGKELLIQLMDLFVGVIKGRVPNIFPSDAPYDELLTKQKHEKNTNTQKRRRCYFPVGLTMIIVIIHRIIQRLFDKGLMILKNCFSAVFSYIVRLGQTYITAC